MVEESKIEEDLKKEVIEMLEGWEKPRVDIEWSWWH